jgi:hypothetical protein
MVAYEHLLTIGRNPDGMLTFLALCTCVDLPQYLLVRLTPGLRQSSTNLSVQLPTKIGPIFHPFKKGKFTFVPMFAMVRTILRFGHNLGSNRFVTWVPFPESPTM